MSMRPRDTSAEAWDVYLRALDGMSGEERINVALDLSDTVRGLRLAGLRAEFPEESHQQIVRRYVEEVYGVRLPDSW
jgi:hypothetical protein